MGSFSTAYSADFDVAQSPSPVQLRLGPHTLTVLRAPEVPADYGNGSTRDWGNPESHEAPGCSVQPAAAPEDTVDRDTFLSRWAVYAPPTSDVTAVDRVVWNGNTYEVDGEILVWDFPPLSHLQFILHRSEDA